MGIQLHSWTLFWQSKSQSKKGILKKKKNRKNFYTLAKLPSAVQLKPTFEALMIQSCQ